MKDSVKSNWDMVPLGELCQFQGGTQPPKSKFIYEPKDGYVRLLQIRDFKSDDKAVFVPDDGKLKKCEAEDIMIGRYGASVGQIHRGKAGAYNVALIRTTPDLERLDRDYFYHYLTSDLFQKPLLARSARGAQNGFNRADIAPFPVPLPPLEEQQRIVAVLDEAFEGLARARAHAEANLQNARDLFESYRDSALTLEGVEYDEAPLSVIARFSQGKQVGLKEQSLEDGPGMARFIRIVDYTQEGTEHRFVSDPGERYHVKAHDIVMARYGSPGLIGRGHAGVIANNMFKVSADNSRISNDYLAFALEARSVQEFLGSRGSSTMPALNFGHLDEVIIRYPHLDKQSLIVKKASIIKSNIMGLIARYQAKVQDLDDLRQSLLQKAFAGELT